MLMFLMFRNAIISSLLLYNKGSITHIFLHQGEFLYSTDILNLAAKNKCVTTIRKSRENFAKKMMKVLLSKK